jgi:hypothetical protein
MFQECRHIMPSGLRCHSPALRDEFFCYYHSSLQRSTAPKGKFDDQSLQLPTLEDSSAVQIALTQVLSALGSSQIDSRRAGLLLYGLQIAAQITARPAVLKPSDSVRSVCHEGDGQVLAPENTVCEPPADCPNCLKRDTCLNPLRPFDEFDEVLLEQEEEMMRMTEPL